ncbi:hypothetical protein [Thalassomonas haliotis]|uniref:Uncharacterized protein n=1 Tax=Thalassomonas haliotis TaxID=485448 RepID=A0ABY7VCC8_9GAMM|nr:hypothetical protein [Thalassomonas haliotis]WDE10568.1 hypothetical protein H3N35_20230 [Thalassomonas haliotis]
MTLAVSQKKSSLDIRIYLYIIGLVCLSANVWFTYQLDKQQLYRQQPPQQQLLTSQLTQDLPQKSNNALVAVISSATVSPGNHSSLQEGF